MKCDVLWSTFLILTIFQISVCQWKDGDIRLVGGCNQWEGRVEIYSSGEWGTVIDSNWTDDEAKVVCRKLGHFKPGAAAHSGAYYGEGNGTIHLDFVLCSGREYSLTHCNIHETQDKSTESHQNDVGVTCEPADGSYREGDIRLVGGPHNWEGRVEIFWFDMWRSLMDYSTLTDEDATVVCKQLQHANGSSMAMEYLGDESAATYISNMTCAGSENNITECFYSNDFFAHESHTVAVKCQKGDEMKNGEIRLVGGKNLWQGYVEMVLFGTWRKINYFYNKGAQVICQQLGYSPYDADVEWREYLDVASISVHLSCSGFESRVYDCVYSLAHYSSGHRVNCNIDPPADLHLYYGSHGTVLFYQSGQGVPVANTARSWTFQSSRVLCNELGYRATGYFVMSTKNHTLVHEMAVIDNFNCYGNESRLMDCSHTISYLKTYKKVEIICSTINCMDGQVRLVNDDTDSKGRLDVCQSRRWDTVCNHHWTDKNQDIVCRNLGFSSGSSRMLSQGNDFESGIGPIIDYINCNGTEKTLLDCNSFSHSYGCTHYDDVGLQCAPVSCENGQLRLKGESDLRGRVEVCYNQRWRTISTRWWNDENSPVACKQLGYSFVSRVIHYSTRDVFDRSPYLYNDYRPNEVVIYSHGNATLGAQINQNFRCNGNETRLFKCDRFNQTSSVLVDVGIECSPADCEDGDLSLVEGETETEGRLEICHNQRWGTIGNRGWTELNSQVVCNYFGYDLNGSDSQSSAPQSASKPILFHNVTCSSTALTLLECGYSQAAGRVSEPDVIISCEKSKCNDGDLKLVGGDSKYEGRLEICFDQKWTAANTKGWTISDTQIACKELGYLSSDISYFNTTRGGLEISLTEISCYGSEERLIDCTYRPYDSAETVSDVVAIHCGSDTNPTPEAPAICDNCKSNISDTIIPVVNTIIPVVNDELDKDSNVKFTLYIITGVISLSIIVGLAFGCIVLVYIRKKNKKETRSSGEVVVVGDNVSYVIPSSVLAQATKDSSRNVIKLPLEKRLPPTEVGKKDASESLHDHIYDTCK